MTLTIPQLEAAGDTLAAALTYARAGWYVLPVRRGSKHPGSVVGEGWQHQSSREPEQLVAWYAGSDHGIALHVGRSGAVVFDVDQADKCPEVLAAALAVEAVPFQSTRSDDPRRGHYLFTAPAGRILGNSRGQLSGPWGEVRGRNGVIIVAPSLHEKAASGARYAWQRTGPVPPLPAVLADLLPDAEVSADAVTDAEVVRFLSEHVEQTRPELLTARLRAWTAKLDAGESRHDTACPFTAGAMREARAGFYLAADAAEQLKALFVERATTSRPGDPTARRLSANQAAAEFDGILSWAVAQALAADVDEVRRGIAERVPPRDLDAFTAAPVAEATPAEQPPAATAPDDLDERFPVVDWHELFSTARSEPEWLCEPLLEAGRVTALFSPAKTGKSLLTLEVTAALAAGRPVLGNPAREPIRVLYVDLENSPDDLRERLEHLGYGPGDLGDLRYLSFPSLPALDSPAGGALLVAVARRHGASLVVLDTVSRIIGGEEDSADTFRALYRHAVMPLKAEGRAVLRLDHSGKDMARGQRGSSGKADDVDAVWSLIRRNPTTFDLRRTHSRTNHGADHVTLTRQAGPLRHDVAGAGVPTEADEIMRQLDVLGVPRDAGRPTCRDALKTSGFTVKNVHLEDAIRRRKGLPPILGAAASDGPTVTGADTAPTAAPDAAPHARGQSGGSGGSPSQGLADELPPAPSPQGRGRAVGAPGNRSGSSRGETAPTALTALTAPNEGPVGAVGAVGGAPPREAPTALPSLRDLLDVEHSQPGLPGPDETDCECGWQLPRGRHYTSCDHAIRQAAS